jgi:hypothetical protein
MPTTFDDPAVGFDAVLAFGTSDPGPIPFAPYTSAQINARLYDAAVPMGARFDLLDARDAYQGALPAGTDATAPGSIIAAKVSMNVDRAIKGALELTMLPDSRLVNQLFLRRIRPWLQISMPNGDIVEFPVGTYIWNVPTRDLEPGLEIWNVTLGDKGHLLDAGGPGPAGFSAATGELVTDVVKRALTQIGLTDFTRIAPAQTVVTADLTWGLSDADGQPMTWTKVLEALLGPANYYSLFFDGNGLPVARQVPDLSHAPADVTYSTDTSSITLGATVNQDLARIGNRVTVIAKSPSGFTGSSTADANTLVPNHPLSQASIGYYIDQRIDDQVSSTQTSLDSRARSELYQALSCYESATLNTLANPVHEAFDVVGFQWTGDSEFSTAANFHERAWSIDLFEFTMTHELRRLVTAS